jgi:threonine/homoserine efflux transporter RhtA
LLGQRLTLRDLAAIGLVCVASAGATLASRHV